jgi:hypothetical protein
MQEMWPVSEDVATRCCPVIHREVAMAATKWTVSPKLDDKEMATFLEKAKALTHKYHTELLKEA